MFESDRDLPAVLAVLLKLVSGEPLTTQRTGGPLSRLLAQAGVAQTRAAGRVLLYHRPAKYYSQRDENRLFIILKADETKGCF